MSEIDRKLAALVRSIDWTAPGYSDEFRTFKAGLKALAESYERRSNSSSRAGLLDAAAESRDVMSRAADIMEHLGKRDEAERLRRQADVCRAAIARATGQEAPPSATETARSEP